MATCPADLNNDGKVNIDELNMVLAQWGKSSTYDQRIANVDMNGDGYVGTHELVQVIYNWGDCPISEDN